MRPHLPRYCDVRFVLFVVRPKNPTMKLTIVIPVIVARARLTISVPFAFVVSFRPYNLSIAIR